MDNDAHQDTEPSRETLLAIYEAVNAAAYQWAMQLALDHMAGDGVSRDQVKLPMADWQKILDALALAESETSE